MLSKILCILQISHVEIYMEDMKEIQQNIICGLVLGDVVISNDDFLFFFLLQIFCNGLILPL